MSESTPRRRGGGAGGSGSTPMGGEQRSGPVAGSIALGGRTFVSKTLAYADVDGQAMFEGDIVLGNTADLQAASDPNQPQHAVAISAIVAGQDTRWPNNTVPYDIQAGMANQQRITDAIAHWEANTALRFVLRTAANAAQYPDFVHFQAGGGCSSMVGRRGGSQNLTLGPNCSTGNCIHEIGHAAGLWHEQSREDRGSHVNIVFANIDPAMQHNFLQHIADGDDIGPYDFGSIMHYPLNAFSSNGQNTIVPIVPVPAGTVIGQRNGLSANDIAAINQLYPPQVFTVKEVAKDPIVDTLKEIAKEPSRDTIKEIRKDPIRDTIKEIAKEPSRDTIKEIRKDPIQDTIKEVISDTFKEVGRDPIGPGGPGGTMAEGVIDRLPNVLGGGFDASGQVPFVLAGPNRAPNALNQDLLNAQAQVEQIVNAIAELEQQHQQLIEAYDAAVQLVDALSQGT